MTQINKGQTNRLLGYPADARLLIINADDFGMCNSTNEAITRTLHEGVIRSTTLMVPCPWALHAMHFLADHPQIPFGVHLTVMSEWANYRWRPLTPRDKVPSLVGNDGYFHNFDDLHALLPQLKLDELDMEFRAQIEAVLAAGLKPTHLDWHAIRFGERTDIFELMIRLAKEYGLALRVLGQSWIAKLQSQGLPTNDYDFLDSYSIDPSTKSALYARLLRELPAGLSEWAVHPALDNMELLALETAGNHERQSDFDFFTSQEAKDIVKEEGIILLDYRRLQKIWNRS
jgi:chitin disaccharide deacetylase